MSLASLIDILSDYASNITTIIILAVLVFKPLRLKFMEKFIKPEEDQNQRMDRSDGNQDVIKLALVALLHDRVYNACVFYINQTNISVEDMKNLKHLFDAYAGLGGNGLCHELYTRVLKLPLAKI